MSVSGKQAKMKAFIDALMRRMTLDEKIGQLNLVAPHGASVTGAVTNDGDEDKIRKGLVGGLLNVGTLETVIAKQKIALEQSRLGIPLLFGCDVIHGHRTVFPLPLALACTWDPALIEKSARLAAKEAAADGIKWVFSPMVDVSRDPRWGRVAEGSGEDGWLGAKIAEAMVRGYQGDDLSRADTVMACAKHFALYGAPEGGRDYNSVDMSPVRMHETYLPPFKAAVKAGVGSLMASFNDVNGIPATGHRELLTQILRKDWGFKGFVVSDYTGVNEMTAHGLGDLKTVSALALKAGIDMDMVGEGFLTTLKRSLQDGSIRRRHIDAACRRVLEAKYRLGLFDDPFRFLKPERRDAVTLTPEHRQAAREMAAQSCVLLKNQNAVLPLKTSATIALIGPLADDKVNMLGTWAVAGDASKAVSVLQGMRAQAGGDAAPAILHAKGANITDDPALAARLNCHGPIADIDPRPPARLLQEALEVAAKADVIVAVVGEAKEHSGEASSRTDIGIPENQKDLLKALKSTGKPLVLVTMSGRPLALEWESRNADAILHAWFGGTEAGNGIADVLFGAVNPAGRLTASFPYNVGQVPVYYNHKPTGRPYTGGFKKFTSCYLDAPNEPLYPFGYGLGYTEFSYGSVTLDSARKKGMDTLKASVTVTNTGQVPGHEVVQLYITDPVASLSRPVKELRGFQKIHLQPGESRQVTFSITPDDLKFFNARLDYDWEGGEFIIHIGANARDTKAASVQWEKPQSRAQRILKRITQRIPGLR